MTCLADSFPFTVSMVPSCHQQSLEPTSVANAALVKVKFRYPGTQPGAVDIGCQPVPGPQLEVFPPQLLLLLLQDQSVEEQGG